MTSPSTAEVLSGLGILGEDASPEEPRDLREGPTEPSAAAASAPLFERPAEDASETTSIADALAAEVAAETAPQEAASEPGEDEPETAEAAEARENEQIRAERDRLRQENEAFLAERAEESFEEDWAETVDDGKAFYGNLIAAVKERGYANGRSKTEVDAVIKHMIYEGNEIERLGAPAGTPSYLAWHETTLVNYALAKAERGQTTAQPTELERLNSAYTLTEADNVTLRQFANYPPEARDAIAKALDAKNAKTTTKRQAAEEFAATKLAKHLTNQSAPGVPGPAPKAKPLAAPTNAVERRQLTTLMAHRLGMM